MVISATDIYSIINLFCKCGEKSDPYRISGRYTFPLSLTTGDFQNGQLLAVKQMNARLKEMAERQAELCKVFGNPSRVMILWLLVDQQSSVGEIAEEIGASLQCTSQHLRLMRDKGILTSHREGRTVYYQMVEHELMNGCRLPLIAGKLAQIQE